MEVKKTYNDSGFVEYTVGDSGRIRIVPPHRIFSDPWTVRIPDLSSPTPYGGYVTRAIYYARTLGEIKEALSRFSTEEELLGAYYKSRLAGKSQLF